ncbi:MAG: nucleotidyltransferase domain-containing protein [Nitrososphaeria archaeon]
MIRKYQKMVEEFKNLKGSGKLILFGSVVENKSRFDSDIDIAVVSDDTDFLAKVEEIADEILFKYNKVVTLIKFSQREFESGLEPIIKEIKKRGITIYEGN